MTEGEQRTEKARRYNHKCVLVQAPTTAAARAVVESFPTLSKAAASNNSSYRLTSCTVYKISNIEIAHQLVLKSTQPNGLNLR